MQLTELPLESSLLVKNIQKLDFSEATQIQKEAIPPALEGKDVSGLSQTGTGKTYAFLIPAIELLLKRSERQKALCLTPTRELALQIEEEAKKLIKGTSIRSACLIGGIPIKDQESLLQKNPRLIIATPGRLIDHIKSNTFNPKEVDILIFDEADRMFNMGFVEDMKFVLKKVDPKRQILLFSATMNFSVLNLIYSFDSNPVEINVSKDNLTVDNIKQTIYQVSDREKAHALVYLCSQNKEESIIVFVNYKDKVDWVVSLLKENDIPAIGISSLLRQPTRNKIIKDFSNKKFSVLVATDVASRGLDIDNIKLVINYHLPEENVNYVHRIGRTARAGKEGIAISISSPEDGYNQLNVEKYLGKKIPLNWIPEEELKKEISFPKQHLRKRTEMNKMRKRVVTKTSTNFRQRSATSRSSSMRTTNKKVQASPASKPRRLKRSSSVTRTSSEMSVQRKKSYANRQVGKKPKSSLSYPIVGEPAIYCTKSGKEKTKPVNQPKEWKSDDRVNLLHKIGTRMTSIFTKK